MMFFITEREPNVMSYSLQEIADDWRPAIERIEPYDAVEGRTAVFDERGRRFEVATPRDHPPHEGRTLFGKLRSVDVGRWDFSAGEPALIDTGEVQPEVLRTLLASYVGHLARRRRPPVDEQAPTDYGSMTLQQLLDVVRASQ